MRELLPALFAGPGAVSKGLFPCRASVSQTRPHPLARWALTKAVLLSCHASRALTRASCCSPGEGMLCNEGWNEERAACLLSACHG